MKDAVAVGARIAGALEGGPVQVCCTATWPEKIVMSAHGEPKLAAIVFTPGRWALALRRRSRLGEVG